MAGPAVSTDLMTMYNRIGGRTRVRDPRWPYGEPPVPAEEFAGEGVLLDLPGAILTDVPLIMARYAALRAWALAGNRGPVGAHAASAARAHLGSVGPGWREGTLLRRLLDGARPAGRLLDEAAAEASARGHSAGARALRQAAYRARWGGTGFPPPSSS
jgi:hypothetical protein